MEIGNGVWARFPTVLLAAGESTMKRHAVLRLRRRRMLLLPPPVFLLGDVLCRGPVEDFRRWSTDAWRTSRRCTCGAQPFRQAIREKKGSSRKSGKEARKGMRLMAIAIR